MLVVQWLQPQLNQMTAKNC